VLDFNGVLLQFDEFRLGVMSGLRIWAYCYCTLEDFNWMLRQFGWFEPDVMDLWCRGFNPSIIRGWWVWLFSGECYGSFMAFSHLLWRFGEFQPGVTGVTWIPAKCYGILLDFTWCNGGLVTCNRVLLQLRRFQPSVMAFCWILPRVMAIWWFSTGFYCSYVDSYQVLWHFVKFSFV
jgi:hypothetical protein